MTTSQIAVSNGMEKEPRGAANTPQLENGHVRSPLSRGNGKLEQYNRELGPIVERDIKVRLPENLLLFLEEVSKGYNPDWTLESEANFALFSELAMMIADRESCPILDEDHKGNKTLQELFDKYGMTEEVLDKVPRPDFHDAILGAAEQGSATSH